MKKIVTLVLAMVFLVTGVLGVYAVDPGLGTVKDTWTTTASYKHENTTLTCNFTHVTTVNYTTQSAIWLTGISGTLTINSYSNCSKIQTLSCWNDDASNICSFYMWATDQSYLIVVQQKTTAVWGGTAPSFTHNSPTYVFVRA